MAVVASGQITIVDLNDAKQLQLYINSNQPKIQIFNPNDSSYTPSWNTSNVILTPQLFIAGNNTDIIAQATSIKWFDSSAPTVELVTDSNYTVPTTGLKTLTIKANVLANKNSINYICEVKWYDVDLKADVTAKASIDFAKITAGSNGTNAITAVLTNETHTVATDSAGNGADFTNAKTTMLVYNGATDDSANWTFTAVTSNVTGAFGTGATKNTYSATALSADTGYVDITAKRSGFSDITKRFVIVKNKQGLSATSYWLVPSTVVIQKNISNQLTPANVSINMLSQVGSGAPSFYGGKLIIAESTDGTNFTDKYTSSSNETVAKSYTPSSSSIKAIRVRLYQAGSTPNGTVNNLDEQQIVIVSDGQTGAAGQNSVIATAWTPKGNIVKNATGNVDAQCDLYDGVSLVTTGATYQWYRFNGTAPDQGAGAGWEKLTATVNYGCTNYATKTMTIPATAVTSSTSFLCAVTYNSKTYKDVAVIVDQSDPIQMVLIAAEGTTILNGQGDKNITAKLYQAGVEIDVAGTTYNYTWYKKDATGTLDPNFGGTGINNKTGKTIKLLATSVDGLANLEVKVETKS